MFGDAAYYASHMIRSVAALDGGDASLS
jgi:hypothetical protein